MVLGPNKPLTGPGTLTLIGDTMAAQNILVIDDDFSIRGFLQDFFEDRGFNVTAAGDGADGFDKFQKGNFDLVLCDMLMPKMIGTEVLRRIKELKPDQKVIMMTGVKEDSMMEKAKALGCHLYLTKPVQLGELEARVNECLPS